jgi:hypothetical protein
MPGLECRLTFELTPTAEAGRLARVVQHKPARHTGKLARRSGSVPSEGLGSARRCWRTDCDARRSLSTGGDHADGCFPLLR